MQPEASQQEEVLGNGMSTNDNEELSVTASVEGWYSVDVHGKGPTDVTSYTLAFELNPTMR